MGRGWVRLGQEKRPLPTPTFQSDPRRSFWKEFEIIVFPRSICALIYDEYLGHWAWGSGNWRIWELWNLEVLGLGVHLVALMSLEFAGKLAGRPPRAPGRPRPVPEKKVEVVILLRLRKGDNYCAVALAMGVDMVTLKMIQLELKFQF